MPFVMLSSAICAQCSASPSAPSALTRAQGLLGLTESQIRKVRMGMHDLQAPSDVRPWPPASTPSSLARHIRYFTALPPQHLAPSSRASFRRPLRASTAYCSLCIEASLLLHQPTMTSVVGSPTGLRKVTRVAYPPPGCAASAPGAEGPRQPRGPLRAERAERARVRRSGADIRRGRLQEWCPYHH